MTDLTDAYAALQKADAAGDIEGAKQLASYIRSQSAASNPARSYDAVNGQFIPTGSPDAVAARSPVAGNSFAQNALIGSGKFFTDQALGARQIGATVLDTVSPQQRDLSSLVTGQAPSRLAALQQEAADKRQIDAPVMATAGGKAGQIATGALSTVPLAWVPGAGTYAGAALIGAGMGALNPTTANESRLLNTGLGAGLSVAGQYGSNLVGRWLASRAAQSAQGTAQGVGGASVGPGSAGAQASVSGSANLTGTGGGVNFGSVGVDESAGLNAAQQAAADAGAQLGMRTTPGQATGSRALQQLEAKLESQPMTSGPFNAIKSNNQQVLNRAAAAAIGENSNTVDASVLSQANERLGQVFESVRNPNSIVATNPQQTSAVLDSIDGELRGLLPGNGSVRDNPLVSDLERLAGEGGINAQQLGTLSSKLGRAAAKQMTTPSGDRDWGQALYAVKNHVDDLLQSTLSGNEAAQYAAARGQYRNLMTLTSRTNIVNPSSGNISGVALANKLQQSDRRGFLFGGNQSDLYNAARFAQAFKPIVGDSGTATRSALPSPIDFALSIPLNLATRAYVSTPSIRAFAGARAASAATADVANRFGAQAALPYVQGGLPGLSGTLVPYLTQ